MLPEIFYCFVSTALSAILSHQTELSPLPLSSSSNYHRISASFDLLPFSLFYRCNEPETIAYYVHEIHADQL